MEGTRPRVVVVGAGFAGLSCCEALAREGSGDLEVLVIDRHTYNTFQPLLYEVATAGLNPGDIAFPLRSYAGSRARLSFRQGEVRRVDFAGRSVHFETGPAVRYDYLVLATGATTNFFGVAGAEQHSLALYTMEDAISVRDVSISILERADALGPRPGELTTVLIGGGATGVEMAGTMAELRQVGLSSAYPRLDPAQSRIVLLEQFERLLGAFDPRLGSYARRALERRGVEVRLGAKVAEVGADYVLIEGGERIPCGLVVWTAGVRATDLAVPLDCPRGLGGRVEVSSDLRLVGHGDVFVVGDLAAATSSGSPEIVPQLAQPAIQEGRHAGLQILRLERGEETVPFSYRDKGTMATIGRRAAVAELPFGVRLTGTVAWLAWLGLHIFFLLGFRNRLAVLMNWAWRYVFWKRGTRVIAGT